MARLTQQQLDEAFKQGGSATSAYENAKTRQQQTSENQAAHDAALRQLLQGKQADAENETAKLNQQQAISNAASQQAQDYVENERKQGRKVSASFGPQGAAISVGDAPPRDTTRADNQRAKQEAEYAKRLEKYSGFDSALDEVNAKTNRDGKGGVLTSPDAKMLSSGGLKSAIPSAGMGIAEMLGAVPKGATDERKSMERLQLEYQKAMSGMRVTDQARAQERAAMGYIASGDPTLVAKGIRALAQNVKNAQALAASGFSPEVTGAVHGRLGGDPNERYSQIYNDNAPQGTSAQTGGMPSQDAIQAEIQRRLGGRR